MLLYIKISQFRPFIQNNQQVMNIKLLLRFISDNCNF